MKRLLLLLLLFIPIFPAPFMESCHMLWDKTKACMTSKPGKMICCVVCGIAAIPVALYVRKCIRIRMAKKYAFLVGDTWGIDLPIIYKHFPLLTNKLIARESYDYSSLSIAVKDEYQKDQQIVEAFNALRKGYETAQLYNYLRRHGPQFMLTDNAGKPYFTLLTF